MAIPLPSRFTRSHGSLPRLAWFSFAFAALNLNAAHWDDVAVGMFNDARAQFESAADESGDNERRALRFGEAVSLLNVQPRTSSNIDTAFSIFEEIRAAAPGDDLGLEARYFQGRIEQVHRQTPDLAKAETIFSELARAHPAHPAGQRALIKLAVIRLYAAVDAAERRRRFDEFTASASQLGDVGAKVQMHLLLADVARRFRFGYEEELAHLSAADKAGVIKRSLQLQLLARVGDLARLTGKNDMARAYYTRFLQEFPRTDRRSTIEGYLAALN